MNMNVSIFMSVFNVHVNRCPVTGTIHKINYRPGKFVSVQDKDSEDNEREEYSVVTANGTKVGFVQIAGLVARRIVSFVKEGDALAAGQRFGLIRFGSRLDVFLPKGVAPKVALGQIAVAGETILADSRILQKVEILCGDFAETIAYATPNTLFYFDPPYKPLSKTSSFNSYAKEDFDDSEQIRLRDFCHQVSAHKANFILSNSDVKGKDENDNFFDEIYHAYNIRRVMATRMVNANPDKRGKLSELLIRNYTETIQPQNTMLS